MYTFHATSVPQGQTVWWKKEPHLTSQGVLPADHNEDDVFAVLPIPPRVRKPKGLPPRGAQHLPRSSLQARSSPVDHSKLRNISFKGKEDSPPISLNASGIALLALH